jgi:hypothetical protein
MTEPRNFAEQVTLAGRPYGPLLVIDLSTHLHGTLAAPSKPLTSGQHESTVAARISGPRP